MTPRQQYRSQTLIVSYRTQATGSVRLPLALAHADVARYSPQLVQMGIDLEEVCRGSGTRCYPLGGRT